MSPKPLRAVLYARVSTDTGDQDPEVQLATLRAWVATRGWSVVAEEMDHITGDPARRRGDPPGLRRALQVLAQRRGDVLVVFSVDRLVRHPLALLKLIERVESLKAHVASYEDGSDLDTTSDTGELILFLKGWWARMFLRLVRKGTIAGQARARAAGKRIGRPPAQVDAVQVAVLRAQRDAQGRPLGWRTIAARLGCSYQAVRRTYLAGCSKSAPPLTTDPAVGVAGP